ncbi:hypothetical protein HDU76_011748 [Blyttiomyces sp. JEL0837]|nr:hypothetical protein HDU76_011748 [Blyttiomyces sp. JEL0837]
MNINNLISGSAAPNSIPAVKTHSFEIAQNQQQKQQHQHHHPNLASYTPPSSAEPMLQYNSLGENNNQVRSEYLAPSACPPRSVSPVPSSGTYPQTHPHRSQSSLQQQQQDYSYSRESRQAYVDGDHWYPPSTHYRQPSDYQRSYPSSVAAYPQRADYDYVDYPQFDNNRQQQQQNQYPPQSHQHQKPITNKNPSLYIDTVNPLHTTTRNFRNQNISYPSPQSTYSYPESHDDTLTYHPPPPPPSQSSTHHHHNHHNHHHHHHSYGYDYYNHYPQEKAQHQYQQRRSHPYYYPEMDIDREMREYGMYDDFARSRSVSQHYRHDEYHRNNANGSGSGLFPSPTTAELPSRSISKGSSTSSSSSSVSGSDNDRHDTCKHQQSRSQSKPSKSTTMATTTTTSDDQNSDANLSRPFQRRHRPRAHKCPLPSCESAFARRFNMIQHFRSHARRLGWTDGPDGKIEIGVEELKKADKGIVPEFFLGN